MEAGGQPSAEATSNDESNASGPDSSRPGVAPIGTSSAIEPALGRRRTTRRRDPRSPVLNMHAPHSRLAGRRSQSSLASYSTSSLRSMSSDDGAARASYAYSDHRSRRYNTKRAEASPTVGAHAGALGTRAGEEWLMDSANQLQQWAAGVEEEQDHRREVRSLSPASSHALLARALTLVLWMRSQRWSQVERGEWLQRKRAVDEEKAKQKRLATHRREPYLPISSARTLSNFKPRISGEADSYSNEEQSDPSACTPYGGVSSSYLLVLAASQLLEI
jgi:hypothetical protein